MWHPTLSVKPPHELDLEFMLGGCPEIETTVPFYEWLPDEKSISQLSGDIYYGITLIMCIQEKHRHTMSVFFFTVFFTKYYTLSS